MSGVDVGPDRGNQGAAEYLRIVYHNKNSPRGSHSQEDESLNWKLPSDRIIREKIFGRTVCACSEQYDRRSTGGPK